MNPWYAFIVAGLAFALDNFIALITDRSSNPATLTAKDRRTINIVRTSSGLFMMGFAWLTIANGWSQSNLKITLTSIPESMAYAFAVAGAFRFLANTVTIIAFTFLGSKPLANQEFNKGILGGYMFCIGGLAITWITPSTSPAPAIAFFITLVFFILIHISPWRNIKSKKLVSTINKP